jgi:transcriptional regulator with XRE-family HTH domain
MSEPTPELDLSEKIKRLVEEKGWNAEDLARTTQLNRQTVRQILQPSGDRSLRNSTVAACANALGLSVNDLRTLPLERLLSRVSGKTLFNAEDRPPLLHELATQPELKAWAERNPERSRNLTPDEVEELLGLQGAGGPLSTYGVEHFVSHIERRRDLLEKVRAIAGSDFLPLLEQLVDLISEKIQSLGGPI